MTESSKTWLSRVSEIAISALVGAVVGIAAFHYQQALSRSNLRTAFAGEIEAIRLSIARPANYALGAWETNKRLSDFTFYSPRAVFDGNVSRLGELGNERLVRDVAYLYSILELAREEGRQLKAGTADHEGMLRYTFYLCAAYGQALRLMIELSPEGERVQLSEAWGPEMTRITEAIKKMMKAALSPPKTPSK